ncbi:MAG: TIR domain-containing protein [Candidatus Accumulibacter sp.]|uniref:TIR domain-containing protein n=1 Tax=Candidatus Accumulibacter proximus TaxID=2954385 RepID=A0A935Q0Z8_9PROT|nr:TIR domain-containing protein [Candidatus Accumulibacter proximus]
MAERPVPEKFLVAFSLAGEQRELVQAIAQAVEDRLGRGQVFLDEWFEHYIAGDDADLKLQEIYARRCELAVVCVSGRYGAKPWTQAEHRAIRSRFMQCSSPAAEPRERQAILPVRVGDGEVEGILFNAIVPDVRQRSVTESAELIIARLHLLRPDLAAEPASTRPSGPAWPDKAPPLSWPMADHSGARAAFAELLTAGVPWRLLRICGISETGKSHITRQMLANVLAIPDIACGRFDFKGTTDMAREVGAFVQELGVSVPATSLRLHEGLDQIVAALRQRARPTLLIFDTYEMAGETQEWVEKSLLQGLMRATWLRVVIAGQRVPEPSGAVWATVARPTVQLELPQPADWYDYSRLHRPELKLEQVETACDLARGKASLLAKLLGPGG